MMHAIVENHQSVAKNGQLPTDQRWNPNLICLFVEYNDRESVDYSGACVIQHMMWMMMMRLFTKATND